VIATREDLGHDETGSEARRIHGVDPVAPPCVPQLSTALVNEAQCASDGLIEDFFLSFFGDKGLESGYDFVAAGHDAVHLRLGQIAFGFFR